jgi:hypothetical protein
VRRLPALHLAWRLPSLKGSWGLLSRCHSVWRGHRKVRISLMLCAIHQTLSLTHYRVAALRKSVGVTPIALLNAELKC